MSKLLRPHELRAARKEIGLTQTQLVQAVGMAGRGNESSLRRTAHNWEAGRTRIPGAVSVAVTLLLERHRREKSPAKGSAK